MILLDGKKTSNDIKDEIALEVSEIVNNGGKKPHLAAILVGAGRKIDFLDPLLISLIDSLTKD